MNCNPLPRRRASACIALLCAGLLMASAADAADPATIATQGNGKGATPCIACHGPDGGGQPAAGFPRLAGLDQAYLRKQLDDFASGSRDNPVMKPAAVALSAEERDAIAAYYSRMPVPAAFAKPSAAMPAADSPGALLASRGRWQQQVPACEQCHGPAGVGVGSNFPPLAGQPAAYIEAQLKAWQAGTRHNDPLELMRHLSQSLSDKDIQDVAAWFAAQPLDSKGNTP